MKIKFLIKIHCKTFLIFLRYLLNNNRSVKIKELRIVKIAKSEEYAF